MAITITNRTRKDVADKTAAALTEIFDACPIFVEIGVAPIGGSFDIIATPIGRHAHWSDDDARAFILDALVENAMPRGTR